MLEAALCWLGWCIDYEIFTVNIYCKYCKYFEVYGWCKIAFTVGRGLMLQMSTVPDHLKWCTNNTGTTKNGSRTHVKVSKALIVHWHLTSRQLGLETVGQTKTVSYLTANSSMSMTEIQMNAVRKSNSKIMVLGKTRDWIPPNNSRSSREHTREPGKPTSTSSWYCK